MQDTSPYHPLLHLVTQGQHSVACTASTHPPFPMRTESTWPGCSVDTTCLLWASRRDWMGPLRIPVQNATHHPTQSNKLQKTALQIITHINTTYTPWRLWENPVQTMAYLRSLGLFSQAASRTTSAYVGTLITSNMFTPFWQTWYSQIQIIQTHKYFSIPILQPPLSYQLPWLIFFFTNLFSTLNCCQHFVIWHYETTV